MHDCTAPASIRPGMSSYGAPRFEPSEPLMTVSSLLNKHRKAKSRWGHPSLLFGDASLRGSLIRTGDCLLPTARITF